MIEDARVEILIVEDNPSDAELSLRALKKHNLANNVVLVKDGAEALDFIFAKGQYASREVNHQPRVILLDLKLPKVSGVEVLRKIKSDDRTRNIPVVALTSSSEEPDVKECYKLGVNSYITKPVEFEKFVKTIAELGMYWMVLNQPVS